MARLAVHAGGCIETILLAPNSLDEYSMVLFEIGRIQQEPYIQAILAAMQPQSVVVNIYPLRDREAANAHALPVPPPVNGLPLFA